MASFSSRAVSYIYRTSTPARSLGDQYVISCGNHPSLPTYVSLRSSMRVMPVTLDLGTLVTDSVLLLRSVNSSKEQLSREAADMFLEAASSFNVLLEKYRQSQITMTLSNPNMIFLIYTAAIAHLSGYKIRQAQHRNGITLSSASSTSALQTQLHLLKCLEALGLIGYTWELARRCWKALDGFYGG